MHAESAGIPTLNSARAIHACENKLQLRTVLRDAGVPVAGFRLVLSRRDFERMRTDRQEADPRQGFRCC